MIHTIKGVSGNCSAYELHKFAKEFEAVAKQGVTDEYEDLFKKFQEAEVSLDSVKKCLGSGHQEYIMDLEDKMDMLDYKNYQDSPKNRAFCAKPRGLSENSNFVQNRGIPEKIPQVYGWYSEDIFSGITKSLGKIAFSDSLLGWN